MTPVVRDLDGNVYFRESNGRLLCGGYEPNAKPIEPSKYIVIILQFEFQPSRFEYFLNPLYFIAHNGRYLPEDWDHFHVLLAELLKRIPSLGNTVLERLCNGAEAFSPDCKWIVGESPEIQNYLVAAGMKAVGIAAAGGVGQATTDIITQGYTPYDMYEIDISRFLGLHNNKNFLRNRVKEVPSVHYGLPYPLHEFQTGRNLRMSPIYPALRDAGGVFGQVMGYERPNWFDPEGVANLEHRTIANAKPFRIAYTKTFFKPPWFDHTAKEYAACRESIGLSDYSSFTKIDLWSKGDEVLKALQFICSNDVDVRVGSVIHTGMQNRNGGYENDCSLARLSKNQ